MATTHRNSSRGKWLRSALLAPLFATLIIAVGMMGGCSIAPAPIKDPPHIVATPASGHLTVTSAPSKPIGDVLPIFVCVANGNGLQGAMLTSTIFCLQQ
jgi:hypothetical protein